MMELSTTTSSEVRGRCLAATAELAVRTAVNLQEGQELVVTAPIEAAPLVQHIARTAYRQGARAVTCLYDDPVLIRERLIESSADALDYAPAWLVRGVIESIHAGAARLQLLGPYPDLLTGIDADRIIRAHGALARASRSEAALMSASAINWSALPVVTTAWARQVFPGDAEAEARDRLWKALFDALRLGASDPREAWRVHIRALDARRAALQRSAFAALRCIDGVTDLTIGLASDHRWIGGSVAAANGVEGLQSLPCEEVFTALDSRSAHGRVLFTRPLALGGAMVQNLYAEFHDGALTTVTADSGLDVFEALIGEGEGRRLGEVGLVPASSCVARTGVAFCNPLLDRNAVSHLAFGPSTPAARPADAADDSAANAIHIDCPFGTTALRVDGITHSGETIAIVRDGEFVV